uniref:Vacuolar protein sorting-associated protein 16 homolog n=1 Tax=Terrapene triunguis TaxID=2587831 RepID=A0A674K9T1_9SAUR
MALELTGKEERVIPLRSLTSPLVCLLCCRKFELYSMAWNLKEDLRDCLVAAAPYGGPIGTRSYRGFLSLYESDPPRAAGLMCWAWFCPSPQWKSGQVVQLGWTASEDLLCIQEDGTVLIYNLFCEFKRHFSMGNEVLQNHVREAKVFHTEYGTGVAILTGAHRFSLTTNIDDLKLRRMPEVPGLQKLPSCWAVLSQDRVTIILLAIGQDLYLLDNTSCSVVTPPGISPHAGAYVQMAVSFNYCYLALFTDTGSIWMGTSSLKEKLGEFSCDFRTPPRQMVWHVAELWTLSGERRFILDEDSYLVPELDGVRIFSRTTHEFLHEIPEASEEIFKIASMAPGALLLEAQREYEKQSQKADEYLREIKDQNLLAEAVRQCIEAAGYEHEPETQKSLLRAASFGKCFLDKFPPESFVRTCRDLRVLNAIWDYQIGIPLTFAQYPLPAEGWCCRWIRLDPLREGVVCVASAGTRAQRPHPSVTPLKSAVTPQMSLALGIRTPGFHVSPGKSPVPCMRVGELRLAETLGGGGVALLFYTVVLHLKNELNRGTFFMTLQKQPVALSLYRQFCKHQELETLKDLYNQDDDHQELGNFHVHSSYSSEKRIEGRVAALQNAVDEYYKAKNEFAAKATEDQIKLLRMQRRLQDELDKPYVDYSLHDTVYGLILDGNHKRAEQLYRDFRIPDKRFWWLKIGALAEREDWEEMEKFSKSKKSPIGYLPFVEICMKHHNRHEAKKYAARVTPEQRVKAHILVRELDQAADAAIEHKNENEMNLVLSKCTAATDSSVVEKINRAKAQILKK